MVLELKNLLLLHDVSVVRRSNDRCNVIPIVQALKHTVQSLHDLAFLIPLGLTAMSPPPTKFMLFMNSKDMCIKAGRFLRARVPEDLQDRIVWVHSDMSQGFNERAMQKLRKGELFGVVCTDVAGMVRLKSCDVY
jgi:superfamily II DNA/RNA helicase